MQNLIIKLNILHICFAPKVQRRNHTRAHGPGPLSCRTKEIFVDILKPNLNQAEGKWMFKKRDVT